MGLPQIIYSPQKKYHVCSLIFAAYYLQLLILKVTLLNYHYSFNTNNSGHLILSYCNSSHQIKSNGFVSEHVCKSTFCQALTSIEFGAIKRLTRYNMNES